jgi:hypothetical protein
MFFIYLSIKRAEYMFENSYNFEYQSSWHFINNDLH